LLYSGARYGMPYLLVMRIFFASEAAPEAQAWEGNQDNKAVEDLARLSDHELCHETVAVCQHAAQPGEGTAMEGLDYLTVIRQAVQQKYGSTTPRWFEALATAIAKHEPRQCTSVVCSWDVAPRRRNGVVIKKG